MSKIQIFKGLAAAVLVLLEVGPSSAEGRLRVSGDPAAGAGKAVWEVRSGTAGAACQIRAAAPRDGGDLTGWFSLAFGGGRVIVGSMSGPVPVRRSVDPFRVPGEAGQLRGTVRSRRRGLAWRRNVGTGDWAVGWVRRSDGRTAPEGQARVRGFRFAWDARGAGHAGWRSSWAGKAVGVEVRGTRDGGEIRAGLADAAAAGTVLLARAPDGGVAPGMLAGVGTSAGWARGLRVVWEWRREDPSRSGWRSEWRRRQGGWNLTFRMRPTGPSRRTLRFRGERALGPGLLFHGFVVSPPQGSRRVEVALGLRRTRSAPRGGVELELGSARRAADLWGTAPLGGGAAVRWRFRLRERSRPRWDLGLDLPLWGASPAHSSR